MSEYQYYEFQAIDRPLTRDEMAELRRYSTRATITARSFTNEYNWGSFKGDVSRWMETYFDAFLYLASWNTRELIFRLPRRLLDLERVEQYCHGSWVSVRVTRDDAILGFTMAADAGGHDLEDDSSEWMSALLPLRADIACGDYRALYLAWLTCVQSGEVDDSAREPPRPAGIGTLTPALEAFIEFMGMDTDLVDAAAHGADDEESIDTPELERWIGTLSGKEQAALLARLATGSDLHVRAELLGRFRTARRRKSAHAPAPRTAGELMRAASILAEERELREARLVEEARARRERAAEKARATRLAELGTREAAAWREVDTYIATKKPADYDQAIRLLVELRELCARQGRAGEADHRIRTLCQEHARKPSFLARLRKAGLAGMSETPG